MTGFNPNFNPELTDTYSSYNLLSKYNFIRCLRSVQIEFNINDDGNKVSTPKLILEYNDIFLNNTQTSRNILLDFVFTVKFKKHHSFNGTLEVVLPILMLISFINAMIRAMSYKIRQNKMDYDFEIFGYFFVQLCSNIATSLFVVAIILSAMIFWVYKSQTVVTLLMPVNEKSLIEIFITIAFVLKLFRIIEMIYNISNIDIFFIDWERPKLFENHAQMNFGYTKNTLDTPSMCSSAVREM